MSTQPYLPTQWDHLQEPRRRSHHTAAYLRLLAALDAGWRIRSLALSPSCLNDAETIEFCFTLFHQDRHETRTLKLLPCRELADFISREQLSALWNNTACG